LGLSDVYRFPEIALRHSPNIGLSHDNKKGVYVPDIDPMFIPCASRRLGIQTYIINIQHACGTGTIYTDGQARYILQATY
jgi:hypothetical protein